MKKIIFWTSNPNKLEEIRLFLKGTDYQVTQPEKIEEIREIQANDPIEVFEDKLTKISKLVSGPVIVDDFSFSIEKLNGFPSPYAKYVVKTIGIENIYKLAKGEKAVMKSYIGYCDEKKQCRIFVGKLEGKIIDNPRKFKEIKKNTPLNSIFIPKGEKETLEEIFAKNKNFKNHRKIALEKLLSYLLNN